MFSKIRDLGLSTIDKAKQRANTLFTSMKDKEEEKKKSKGLGFSIFDKDEEKPKEIEQKAYDKAKTTIDKEKEGKEKMQKRADILYPDSKIENLTEKNQKEKEFDVFEKKEKDMKEKEITENKVEKEEKTNINDNATFSDETIKKAREFIGESEGIKLDAYQDGGGVWTIGYGHTKNVKQGDKITKEEAEKLYKEDFEAHGRLFLCSVCLVFYSQFSCNRMQYAGRCGHQRCEKYLPECISFVGIFAARCACSSFCCRRHQKNIRNNK